MQTYKIFDRVFRCEFRLFIGELEDFKAANRKMDGYPGDDERTHALGWNVDLASAIAVWLPEFSMARLSGNRSLLP